MNKALSLILVFILLNLNATLAGNATKIDSLKHVIKSETGLNKYGPLISLVRELATSDHNEALSVAEAAYQLANHHGDTSKIVQAGRICGQLLNYLGRNNEAITILSKTLPVAIRNNFHDDIKTILINLGIAHTFRSEYDKALSMHFQVLALTEKDRDSLNTGYSLNNIGLVYYKMKNFSQALLYYQKALDLQMSLKDYYDIERLLINLGLCYNHLKQFNEAQKYFQKALATCNGNCHDQVVANGQLGMAISFLELKNYNQARDYFQLSYQVAKKIDHKRFIAENLFGLAKINIVENNLTKAIDQLFEAERIAKSEGYKELLIGIYEQLSNIFDIQQDYQNASHYLKKYVALKDSVYNENVIENLAKAKSDYEQRENLAIIKANEMTIAHQRRLNTAVIIIAVLAAILVFVLWRTNRAMLQVNTELSRAKDVIFEQNKQLEVKNKELDRLVEKKTEELKLVNLSLKQKNDDLDTFIYRTVQDIKAPLASLKGICNVALKDIQEEASLLYLNKIDNTTELLNSILNRLLTINKINHAKIVPTEINLKSLLDNVISLQQKKGLPHNLIVRKNIVDNAIIRSDKEVLSTVLENLMDTAIRFCNNSTKEEHFIEINVAPGKNGRIKVRLVDNGAGNGMKYAPEDLDKIFLDLEPDIEQAKNESQDLYFVKTAAKRIGGEVDVKKTVEGYNELSLVI